MDNKGPIYEKIELLIKPSSLDPRNKGITSITKEEFLDSRILISGDYIFIEKQDDSSSATTKIFHLSEVSSYRTIFKI